MYRLGDREGIVTQLVLLAALVMAGPPETAADVISLRDGKVVLGQIVDGAPKGKLLVVVRRAWAEKAAPDRFKAWEKAEAPAIKRAKNERIARLESWRRERAATADDPIAPWIDSEIDRLKADADTPPLMLVTLNRGDVKTVTRRPPEVARKLRQAWRVKFDDAETKPLADLESSLENRGFASTGDTPILIDDLLPVPPESDAKWRARRAATEVAQEKSLKFIRTQGMVMPDGPPGEGANPLAAVNGLVKSILGGDAQAEDPLEARGREVSSKGRIGMMVTSLETAEDASAVTVEIILYAKMSADRWDRVAFRSAKVRASDMKTADGAIVANDPQVQSVFKAVEGLGLDIPEDVKRKGLAIGAATQKALASARTAIQPDLDALELPVGAANK
jgi:hypothetical protein